MKYVGMRIVRLQVPKKEEAIVSKSENQWR